MCIRDRVVVVVVVVAVVVVVVVAAVVVVVVVVVVVLVVVVVVARCKLPEAKDDTSSHHVIYEHWPGKSHRYDKVGLERSTPPSLPFCGSVQ